jgi:hypothetical protein
MIEAGVVVGEEVVLEGCVAQIIETDWEKVVTLNASVGKPPMRTGLRRSQLEPISRIINLPLGWEFYTIVDDTSPIGERLYHVKMCRDYITKHIALYTPIHDDFNNQSKIIIAAMGDTESYSLQYQEASPLAMSQYFMTPFFSNSWLQMSNDKIHPTSLLATIDWEVVDKSLTLRRKIDVMRSVSMNTAGRYSCIIRLSHFFLSTTLSPDIVVLNIDDLSGINGVHLAKIYYKSLDSIRKDDSPQRLGVIHLAGITNNIVYTRNVSLRDVVNRVIMNVSSDIDVVAKRLGTHTLERILACVEHAISTVKMYHIDSDQRIEELAIQIEEYLITHPHLPKRVTSIEL